MRGPGMTIATKHKPRVSLDSLRARLFDLRGHKQDHAEHVAGCCQCRLIRQVEEEIKAKDNVYQRGAEDR